MQRNQRFLTNVSSEIIVFYMSENVSTAPQDASKTFPNASNGSLKHLKTVLRRSTTGASRSKTPSDRLLGAVLNEH